MRAPEASHRPARMAAALALWLLASTALPANDAPLLTGEVFSLQAQEIIVPLTSTWQARISRMIEEGSAVQPGDVVVEFDGAEAARQLEQQREAARAERAKTDRDLARLEKEVIQAEYALELAVLAVELAELAAATPKDLIGAIEYEENQLALERAVKEWDNAEQRLADVSKSLRERRQQARLDEKKAELAENWWQDMLESFTVKADQAGYVIYGNHPWTRDKYQEGDTVRTSFNVAQVADTGSLAIKVWINSVDRPRMEAGSAVRIVFDALPSQQVEGELISISDSGSKKNDWGDAVYYEGVVAFDDAQVPGLLPGMSALVEPL